MKLVPSGLAEKLHADTFIERSGQLFYHHLEMKKIKSRVIDEYLTWFLLSILNT
jgi:hypothetical protein